MLYSEELWQFTFFKCIKYTTLLVDGGAVLQYCSGAVVRSVALQQEAWRFSPWHLASFHSLHQACELNWKLYVCERVCRCLCMCVTGCVCLSKWPCDKLATCTRGSPDFTSCQLIWAEIVRRPRLKEKLEKLEKMDGWMVDYQVGCKSVKKRKLPLLAKAGSGKAALILFRNFLQFNSLSDKIVNKCQMSVWEVLLWEIINSKEM